MPLLHRNTAAKSVVQPQTESLDYHLINNKALQWHHHSSRRVQKRVLGLKPHTIVKCITTVVTGLLVGLLAVALGRITETTIVWKNTLLRSIVHGPGYSLQWGMFLGTAFHVGYSVLLVIFGSSLVQFIAPVANGAGVSLIMAYLNGNSIPDLLTFRTLLVKFVGTCCGVCANISLGPEAPTVHIGACVADNVTHLACGLCERWDALQGCWQRSSKQEQECVPETNTRRRVRFLEHITSHISSVLSTENCKSSIHSQLQESLLPAGVSAAVGEQKAQGCTCGQPGLACTCCTNSHHEKSLATGHENSHMESCHHETGHKGGRAQRTARTSPFAKVDMGMGMPGTPGAHGSVCSCQRCNHDSPDVPESSLSGDGGKSMQAAATPGPALVLHSDADRREFISAGAAAGLAAAFGAPIGGVLFSMEEACTHWSRKVAWRCFTCTTVAVLVVTQLNPEWSRGVLSVKGVKDMGSKEWLVQLPFIALVSICSGLLGALFNALHKLLRKVRMSRHQNLLRITEAAVLAAVTIVIMILLSWTFGTCVEVPEWLENGYGITFHCPDGSFNDLATAYMAFPDRTISHLFSLGSLTPQFEVCQGDNCYFTLRSLIILCPSYLLFMVINGGLSTPGGLFMPSIMVGGSFGAVCGLLLMRWLPTWEIQPGLYAMCAAAAMLGGVFRASISLVVIFVESSKNTSFIVGIIIAVICSNWIGEAIHSDGIYETDLEADGSVIFLRPSPPPGLNTKKAIDIACKAVWTFRTIESVAYVTWVLRHCGHNGFPVVRGAPGDSEDDNSDNISLNQEEGQCSREGPLEGVILRSQLMVLLINKAFCDERGEPLTLHEAGERLSRELELDKEMRMYHRRSEIPRWASGATPAEGDDSADGLWQLQPHELLPQDAESLRRPRLYMDLRPFVDSGPLTVRQETSAFFAHTAFVSLGLRHLCVVDEHSHVRGIITRRDLDAAAGHGAWRRNRMAPAPGAPDDKGLHMPSRASSGALHRLSAIRHMVRTQRPARARSAKNLQKLFEYGQSTPDITRWLAGHSDTTSNSSGYSGESDSEHAPQHSPHAQASVQST